ncbi:DUF3951 domain-containing protein [Metabacillus fastidiosus]|uniref:DUF3951 domain-containing protein n=1 Tax=Metabacillus fastidiosus TaxID=1458 RepID=A0ABU6P147_9BACI|nr:DUF3951 domain-containing protein [Metabacillus fastidiosus]MED4403085.1 DUF3951 domain-containing protein [Metabacillus fastidiosus]MED4455315.1 DUF3951 domain-containing protein [Metabacillus fastidiosus]MED4461506.1 DUF3951 domain-containing protein [Metabacillus fastidiosus]
MELYTKLTVIVFPILIVSLLLIGLYKHVIKKKNITVHYTPFDEITGHSPVRFHEEQEIIVEDEKCCNDKDKKIAKRNQK